MAHTNKKRITAAILVTVAFVLLLLFAVCLQAKDAHTVSDSTADELLDYVTEKLDERVNEARLRLEQHSESKLFSCRLVAYCLGNAGVRAGRMTDYATDDRLAIFDRLINKESTCYAYLVDKDGNVLLPFEYIDVASPEEEEYAVNYGDINLKERWGFTDTQWQELLAGTGETDSDGRVIYEPYRITRKVFYEEIGLESDVDCILYCSDVLTELGEESGLYVLCAEQFNLVISDYTLNLNVDFGNSIVDGVQFCSYDELRGFASSGEEILPVEDESLLKGICSDGYHGEVATAAGTRTVDTRLYHSPLSGDDIYIFAVRGQSGIGAYRYAIFNVVIAIIAVLLFALFTRFVKTGEGAALRAGGRKKLVFNVYMERGVLKKLRPVLALTLAGTFVLSWLITSLCCISDSMRSVSTAQERNTKAVEESAMMEEIREALNERELLQSAQLLASYLSTSDIAPELIELWSSAETTVPYYYVNGDGVTGPVRDINGNAISCRLDNENLKSCAEEMGIDSLTVYSLDGYAILTTEKDKPDRITAESPLYDVLMRKKEYVISPVGETRVDVALPVTMYESTDSHGNSSLISKSEYEDALISGTENVTCVNGILVTRKTVQESVIAGGMELSLKQIQDNSEGSYLTMAFAHDEERTPIYVPNVLSGGDSASMALPEGLLTGTYYGFAWLNGAKYLLCSRPVEKTEYSPAYWMVTTVSAGTVYRARLASVLITLACVTAACVLVTALAACTGKEERETLRDEARAEAQSEYTDRRGTGGVILPWRLRTPGQKIVTILRALFFAFLIALGIKAMVTKSTVGTPSVLMWVLTRRWDRGVNIFSLTAVLLIFCAVLATIYVITRLIGMASSSMNGRTATCLSVFSSIIKYGAIIFSFFYGLYLLGLDTSSVLTSFAAFSMLIGLGANKLIGDIVAGIFLVIENEFHVGDIVTVNGFCGKVTEIGIRTTKIENKDGNVNIFTNSTINSVLNMTSNISRVKIDLNISSENSVEEVEQMLKEVLPDIERRCPIPHKNLRYLGVDNANGKECTYRVEAECSEFVRNALYRYMNRELVFACKKYNIGLI